MIKIEETIFQLIYFAYKLKIQGIKIKLNNFRLLIVPNLIDLKQWHMINMHRMKYTFLTGNRILEWNIKYVCNEI